MFAIHVRWQPILIWLHAQPLHSPWNPHSVIPMLFHISHAYKGYTTGPLHVLFPLRRVSLLPLIQPPTHQPNQPFFCDLDPLTLAPSWPCRYLHSYSPMSVSTSHLVSMYLGTYLHHSCASVSVFPAICHVVCTMSSSSLYPMA